MEDVKKRVEVLLGNLQGRNWLFQLNTFKNWALKQTPETLHEVLKQFLQLEDLGIKTKKRIRLIYIAIGESFIRGNHQDEFYRITQSKECLETLWAAVEMAAEKSRKNAIDGCYRLFDIFSRNIYAKQVDLRVIPIYIMSLFLSKEKIILDPNAKLWLDHLLTVVKYDPNSIEADDSQFLVRYFIDLMRIFSITIEPRTREEIIGKKISEVITPEALHNKKKILAGSTEPTMYSWYVPSHLLETAQQLTHSTYHHHKLVTDETAKFDAWYQRNKTTLQIHMQQLWDEIIKKAHRGIRKDEVDMVKIALNAINLYGPEKFSFCAEESDFPDIRVKIYGKLFGREYLTPSWLMGGALGISRGWPECIGETLNFLVVHALHIIMVGDERDESISRLILLPGKSRLKSAHTVAPHKRVLSGGRKASDDLHKRAEEYFKKTYPDNVTFIDEYERGKGEQAEQKPIFVYTKNKLDIIIN